MPNFTTTLLLIYVRLLWLGNQISKLIKTLYTASLDIHCGSTKTWLAHGLCSPTSQSEFPAYQRMNEWIGEGGSLLFHHSSARWDYKLIFTSFETIKMALPHRLNYMSDTCPWLHIFISCCTLVFHEQKQCFGKAGKKKGFSYSAVQCSKFDILSQNILHYADVCCSWVYTKFKIKTITTYR